jgi:hypothetical protein
MTTTSTTIGYLATTAEDWRAVARAADALGASADDCWAASDDAWDRGDLSAARMLARAAAWFSETPSQRRASRAFDAPESRGLDTIGSDSIATSGVPSAHDRRRHDARPGAFCVCDACAYTGSARGAW